MRVVHAPERGQLAGGRRNGRCAGPAGGPPSVIRRKASSGSGGGAPGNGGIVLWIVVPVTGERPTVRKPCGSTESEIVISSWSPLNWLSAFVAYRGKPGGEPVSVISVPVARRLSGAHAAVPSSWSSASEAVHR